MVKKTTLYNSDNEKLYPRTSAECVGYGDGTVKDALDSTGVGDYPAFSASTVYSAGDVVNYNGKLYKFTADHAAGAWTGSDVEKTDTVKARIVQELGDSGDAIVSQKVLTEVNNNLNKKINDQESDIVAAKNLAIEEINTEKASAILSFNTQRVTPEMLSESTKQLINTAGGGTINNLPDEEDITSTGGDMPVLKFKDKSYDKNNFSGLGRVYLRKNIIDGKNVLTQDMINQENTEYIIQYDYDLNGQNITIPEGCVLKFNGGKFSNGKITITDKKTKLVSANLVDVIYNTSYVKYVNVNSYNIYGDGTTDNSDRLQEIIDNLSNVILYFPAGNYLFTKTVFLKSNVIINGDVSAIKIKNTTFTFQPNTDNTSFFNTSDTWQNAKISNIRFYSDAYNVSEDRNEIYNKSSYLEDNVWKETISKNNIICFDGSINASNCSFEGFHIAINGLDYSVINDCDFIRCKYCLSLNSDNIITNCRANVCCEFIHKCFSMNNITNIRLDSIKDVAINIQGRFNNIDNIICDFLYKSVIFLYNNCEYNNVRVSAGRYCVGTTINKEKNNSVSISDYGIILGNGGGVIKGNVVSIIVPNTINRRDVFEESDTYPYSYPGGVILNNKDKEIKDNIIIVYKDNLDYTYIKRCVYNSLSTIFNDYIPVFINNEKMRVIFNVNNYNFEGRIINNINAGITSNRPSNPQVGFQYFDATLNKPIWWTGSAWVDSTGANV